MKKIIKIVMIFLFMAVLVGLPLSYYTIKSIYNEESDVIKNIDFDLKENRTLNEFEYKNLESLPHDFEEYFNDHIPFRSFWIKLKRDVESSIEAPYINSMQDWLMNFGKEKEEVKQKEIHMLNEKCMDYPVRQFTNHALMPDEIEYVTDEEYPVKIVGQAILGRKKWLFFNSVNLDYYKGNNVLPDDQYENYVKKYKDLDELCKKKGKKIIYFVAPDKDQVYGEYMPTIEKMNEVGRVQRLKEYIASTSNINYIYPLDELKERKPFYRLYKKYDTHYNKAGAYICFQEILKADGKEYVDIDDLKIDKEQILLSDLVALSGQSDTNYLDDNDYIIHYKDDVKVNWAFHVHDEKAAGDVSTWLDIYESDIDSNEVLLVLGDSFKENLKPYLPKDYKKTIFISAQSHDRYNLMKQGVEEANVILIECVERNENVHIPAFIKEVTNFLKNLPDVN